MVEVLQIIPAPPDDRIAWYNEGKVNFTVPTCLALVKKGTTKSVVYMETTDDEIEIVDPEDKAFLGFVKDNDSGTKAELEAKARKLKEK